MTSPVVARRSRRLLWHGVFLFLLGLLTGFLVPVIENPSMGLLSCFEGILNGMVLAIVGLAWPRLRLPAGAFTTACWLALYGAYVSWATTLFAAWLGVGKWLPIVGGEETGEDWQEGIIKAGLVSSVASLVIVCWILLRGLSGRAEEDSA